MKPAPKRALGAMLLAALLVVHGLAIADLALDTRLKKLESELRCLVCQNQTLADSNADLAADLRKEVRELAVSGKTDAQIKQYLVARYGDFVLYRPPVKPETWLLWFGPFAMLAGGVAVWWGLTRRRRRVAASDATPAG
ncbi:MAG: cytochrome c-type biogenesis protein, partial [Casimicrobiaceae bacterium]